MSRSSSALSAQKWSAEGESPDALRSLYNTLTVSLRVYFVLEEERDRLGKGDPVADTEGPKDRRTGGVPQKLLGIRRHRSDCQSPRTAPGCLKITLRLQLRRRIRGRNARPREHQGAAIELKEKVSCPYLRARASKFSRIPYARNPVSENYPYRKPKRREPGLPPLHCLSASTRGLSLRPCTCPRPHWCWSCPCSTASPLGGDQTCCTPCRDRQTPALRPSWTLRPSTQKGRLTSRLSGKFNIRNSFQGTSLIVADNAHRVRCPPRRERKPTSRYLPYREEYLDPIRCSAHCHRRRSWEPG